MSLGTLLPYIRQQFFDGDGNPLANGQLFSYLAGTSTAQALYTTTALDVALSNPVVLDADGYAPAMYTTAQALKLELRTSAGALIWNQDNVYPDNLFVGVIQTPQAFGHAIGGPSPSAPDAAAFALVGNFTPDASTTSAEMIKIAPDPLDLSSATGITTVSLMSVSGNVTLPATASASLSCAGVRITAPSLTYAGATPAAVATLQVTAAPTIGTLQWGLQVSNSDTRLRGALVVDNIISPSQITSNQNDYNPTGLDHAFYVRLTTDASRNITGLNAVPSTTGTGQRNGRLLIIKNVGAQNVVLKHADAASTAANRFDLPSATDLTLGPGDAVQVYYDTTASRWAALGL